MINIKRQTINENNTKKMAMQPFELRSSTIFGSFFRYERNLTSNHSMYAVQGEEFEATYDGFGACERIDINVSSESGCGAILSRQYTHVSVFTYTSKNRRIFFNVLIVHKGGGGGVCYHYKTRMDLWFSCLYGWIFVTS